VSGNPFEHIDRPWIPPELADAVGLVGVGGDLRPQTLLLAYSDGVFPWFNSHDPVLWWSPDPRAILPLDDMHVPRRLARTIRQGKFRVTVNECFEDVMRACGNNRPEGTWVTEGMVEAYVALHRLGFAHSVETWVSNQLAGGTYGVAIGGLFAAESMFYRVTDGSKAALVFLVERLRERGYELLDVQMATKHTQRFGVVEIPRCEYLRRLRKALRKQVTFV
jgi:leucyl/phenylalanyl-tRNA--protein transferase